MNEPQLNFTQSIRDAQTLDSIPARLLWTVDKACDAWLEKRGLKPRTWRDSVAAAATKEVQRRNKSTK